MQSSVVMGRNQASFTKPNSFDDFDSFVSFWRWMRVVRPALSSDQFDFLWRRKSQHPLRVLRKVSGHITAVISQCSQGLNCPPFPTIVINGTGARTVRLPSIVVLPIAQRVPRIVNKNTPLFPHSLASPLVNGAVPCMADKICLKAFHASSATCSSSYFSMSTPRTSIMEASG